MIKNTFTFIPGIAYTTERYLWEKGIVEWDDLRKRSSIIGSDKTRRRVIDDYISKATEALDMKDITFFSNNLPPKDQWRLYNEFKDKTLFLDIETTGLSQYYDVITLIGGYDGKKIKIFIKDNNFDQLKIIEDYSIIVTFNGKIFDVPFIKKEMPNIKIPPIHLDLRFLLRNIGFGGPLKKTEKKLGLIRGKEIEDIDGRKAAILWNWFLKGDLDALRRLVQYNISDIVNLEFLMNYCYKVKLEQEILPYMHNNVGQQRLIEKEFNYSIPDSNYIIPEISIKESKRLIRIFENDKELVKVNRKKIKTTKIKINGLIKKIKEKESQPLCVGIDLTGSEKRATGVAILDGKKAYLSLEVTDDDIISKTIGASPELISIDSPLSIPKGRDCTDDNCECRKLGITRECERTLKKRGVNVYPCLIQSMQKLTLRGMKLANTFREKGYEVIESYPGAAQDILGFPRKKIDLDELKVDLMNMGIVPFSEKEKVTHDEIDALTSALVGYFYLAGMYEPLGNLDEGYLIIPKINNIDKDTTLG